MPTFPFTTMAPARARRNPLGPTTLNQLNVNVGALDDIARVEHFNDGGHNALEIPWLLGHMDDAATPTGYLFDTTYAGTTLGRPATGAYTSSIVSGVVSTAEDGVTLQAANMANVADSAIETKPHTITSEAVSATSWKWRVRSLSSALGGGNTWADVNRDIDVGLHCLPQDQDASLLASYSLKQRRSWLTEEAVDWNAVVGNQGIVRKASLVEHTSTGRHSANRIAKAVAWVRWTGAAFVIDASERVASVSNPGGATGVVELVMSDNFSATTTMACFPEVQPATVNEIAIVNGRGFATGAGTSAFRFYIYAFDGVNWDYANRSFFVAMYGAIA